METQAAQSQDTSDVTNTFTPVGPEDFEVTQLADPACCVSAVLQRPFVGRLEYEGEKQLDATVEAAKQVLPEIDSTYKPSGKTSMLGVLAMLVLAPVLLVFLMLVCGGVSIGWAYLCENAKDSRATGIGSIVLDGLMVFLMVWLPKQGFALVSRWLKNRNPMIPAILVGLLNFLLAIILFAPIWGGATLAPTDLTFIFVPIRWVLIIVGCLIVPIISASAVYGKICEQKFCEHSGLFLKPLVNLDFAYDFTENVRALLEKGETMTLMGLPKADEPMRKKKHYSRLTLWGHPKGRTFFIELNVHFHGSSKPQKTLTTEKPQSKTVAWLTYSRQLDRQEVYDFLLATRPAAQEA